MKDRFKLKNRNTFFNKRVNLILCILFVIVVGYALIQTTVLSNATVNVATNSWLIRMDDLIVNDGSVVAEVPAIINESDKTKVAFKIVMSKPDDYYEFEVDMINDGIYDAMIKKVTLSGIPDNLKKYVLWTATYSDGSSIKVNDLLASKSKNRIRVRASFNDEANLADILDANSDFTDTTFDLALEIVFGQTNENVVNKRPMTIIENLDILGEVQSDSGIDFSKTSEQDGTKGLFLLESTKNNDYPIYYYRGDVENNNMLFANYCWKIVRTTETGGTKLIYNGLPREVSGMVPLEENEYVIKANPASSASATYSFKFNDSTKKWVSGNKGVSSSISGIEFTIKEEGHYILHYTASSESANLDFGMVYKNNTDTKLGGPYGGSTNSGTIDLGTIDSSISIIATYKKDGSVNKNDDNFIIWLEREMEPTTTCNNVRTATQLLNTSVFNSLSNDSKYVGYMYDSNTDSTIKTVLDTWYSENIESVENNKHYEKYLEDTVWCNDRSVGSIDKLDIYYGSYARLNIDKKPTFTCENRDDKYTVNNENLNGNNLLTYPVSLLTADEIAMAGGVFAKDNKSYYLYTGQDYWTLSPRYFNNGSAYGFRVSSSGYLGSDYVNTSYGVRPVVSLSSNTKIEICENGVTGTANCPYRVVEE